MNIGIVTAWFPAGAGYVSKAYRQILEKEHSVYVYARGCENRKGDPIWDDANVTWAPEHYVATGIWPWHFRRWIRSKKLDVVFFNEQRQWWPVVIAKKEGVTVGAYIDYYTQITVPAFAIYDFLICNTKRHYSVFSWHPNCCYVPWGVDINQFRPSNITEPRILTFLISAGWQGKWDGDRRGTLLALNAFRDVRGECRLIVYSQAPLEEMTSEWKFLLSNDDRIELRVGTFEPFPFSEGDVYLYPSRLDGIGLTLPEAMSCGLAAITTNAGPMNEFITDQVTGLLVSVDKYLGRNDGYYWAENICSLESLRASMQWYLDNKELIQEHKKNAREYATAFLDWMKNGMLLLEFLKLQKSKELTSTDIRLARAIDQTYSQSLWQRVRSLNACLHSTIKALRIQ